MTEGRAYSAAEYRGWLKEAGLTPRPVTATLIHCGVLAGVKEGSFRQSRPYETRHSPARRAGTPGPHQGGGRSHDRRQRRRPRRKRWPTCRTPTPSSARSRRRSGRRPSASLGPGADRQPRTLPLPRTDRPSVRADQHARPVLRRDRRSGVRLRSLFRPQPPPLRPPAGAGRGRRSAARAPASPSPRVRAWSTPSTAPTCTWPTARSASSAWAASAPEVARRGLAFGMRVLAVDPVRTEAPQGVEALWPVERLPELLGESDFVVIAAPHTPRNREAVPPAAVPSR